LVLPGRCGESTSIVILHTCRFSTFLTKTSQESTKGVHSYGTPRFANMCPPTFNMSRNTWCSRSKIEFRGATRAARSLRSGSTWCPWSHGNTDAVVEFTTNELTATYPITAQPDFYELKLSYRPKGWLIESKALKLYLWASTKPSV
jgi:hypothetical protein